jgi:hypothetical protein
MVPPARAPNRAHAALTLPPPDLVSSGADPLPKALPWVQGSL